MTSNGQQGEGSIGSEESRVSEVAQGSQYGSSERGRRQRPEPRDEDEDDSSVGNQAEVHAQDSEIEASADDEEPQAGSAGRAVQKDTAPVSQPAQLTLNLSHSLVRKLQTMAQKEGMKMGDLAVELVSEGLVLRAWEIFERKEHLQGNSQGGGNNRNFNNRGNQGGNHGGNHSGNHRNFNNRGNQQGHQGGGNKGGGGFGRRMNHNRYTAIMDDKEQFLEYVRAQEKKNR